MKKSKIIPFLLTLLAIANILNTLALIKHKVSIQSQLSWLEMQLSEYQMDIQHLPMCVK